MEAQPDFEELLALLNAHSVEYVIVGAHALAFHGIPRYTGDIDILVRPHPENAQKTLEALTAFGFESLGLTPADFTEPDQVIQLGVPPVRVDLLTSIDAVTWEEAKKGREVGQYGQVPVFYLGRREYIANKRATARRKDLADLEALGEQ